MRCGFGALRTFVGGEAGDQKQRASRDNVTKHDLPLEEAYLILPDKFTSAKNRNEHVRLSTRPATEPWRPLCGRGETAGYPMFVTERSKRGLSPLKSVQAMAEFSLHF